MFLTYHEIQNQTVYLNFFLKCIMLNLTETAQMLFLILFILFKVTFQLYFQNYHHTCQTMSFGSVSYRILDIVHYFTPAYNTIQASGSSVSL